MIVSLLSSRKNSKYLAHFLHTYKSVTTRAPLLTTYSAQDTWNTAMIEQMYEPEKMEFFSEDRGLGRRGLHLYYEAMVPRALELGADWVAYFCEDHRIITHGWDIVCEQYLRNIDPSKPAVAVPGWFNTGSVSHILSRGYIEALGNRLGCHGNIDSAINHTMENVKGLPIVTLPRMFWDYTADTPSQLDDSRTFVQLSRDGEALPASGDFYDERTQSAVRHDKAMLVLSLGGNA